MGTNIKINYKIDFSYITPTHKEQVLFFGKVIAN